MEGAADGQYLVRSRSRYASARLAVLVKYRTAREERAVDVVGDLVDVNDALEITEGSGERGGQLLFLDRRAAGYACRRRIHKNAARGV